MPEKSGIDAALGVPLPVGPAAGARSYPKAGIAAAAANAANAANTRKSRRCMFMISSRSWSAGAHPNFTKKAGTVHDRGHAQK